jgi:predicted ArsR family transcriptional regulator
VSKDADVLAETTGWMNEAVLRAVACLDDPSRRALYAFIRSRAEPVTREVAAEQIGISRKLAAFHLEKLVEAGLLTAEFDTARRARAMGRTPKVYRPSSLQVSVSIPEREHGLLAEMLVDGVASDEAARDAVLRAGASAGERLGAAVREQLRPGRLGPERALTLVATILQARGFDPLRELPTSVCLRNCPFHPLAARAPDLVCGLNLQFIDGLLRGLEASGVLSASLAPRPDHCCVEVRS